MIARQRHRPGRPAGQRGGLDRVQPAGGPRRPSSRRGSRGSPSASRICQTVCAETGIPSAVSAAAISVTECPAARSSSARARSVPVALRGPFGPGLASANRSAGLCAAAWPSGGRWRWSSRTGRRPRRRAYRRGSRRAAPHTGAAPRGRVGEVLRALAQPGSSTRLPEYLASTVVRFAVTDAQDTRVSAGTIGQLSDYGTYDTAKLVQVNSLNSWLR